MLIIQNNPIIDPALMNSLQIELLRLTLYDKYFAFLIPEYLTSNKDKKDYKAGYLNEVYGIVFPEALKKTIFAEVTKKFDIFVDERQFQNMIHVYTEKKYSLFIKK